MTYVKWTLIALFWLLVAAFLHYTLPQQDVVRITDTYEKRVDPGQNSLFWAQADVGSDGTVQNRDVFFIQSRRSNGNVMVYRNEDTGWGWPPFFKFNTANLQAEAADLISTADQPRWAVLRHYGWRLEFISIFPNAMTLREIPDPDVRLIPWQNILILTFLAAVFWAVRVRWMRFWARRVDPMIEATSDRLADGGDRVRGMFGSK